MTDQEIMQYLRWLYAERPLCAWCHHPNKRVSTRGLCSHCYALARDFRSNQTASLAKAIDMARSEGIINPVSWPITGLELERLFERIGNLSFPWRKPTDNPFWHSANTWNESFTEAQRRLLFHHFSMIVRERERRARRLRADWIARFEVPKPDLRKIMKKALKAVRNIFPPKKLRRGATA